MSTFYRWFSNIYFPSQCLFFERGVEFTVSLYYNENVGSQYIFHIKGVPKKFRKTHRRIYICRRLFFNKVEVIFKNDSLVVHVGTGIAQKMKFFIFCAVCCSWYLGISLRTDILYKVHIEEMQFFRAFWYLFISNWF